VYQCTTVIVINLAEQTKQKLQNGADADAVAVYDISWYGRFSSCYVTPRANDSIVMGYLDRLNY
jgi:hypothetical protein